MALLLDTHALIWWLFDNPKLSRAARARLAAGEDPVYVSAASAWEIATKVRIGKMPEGRALAENFGLYLQLQSLQALPITVDHARLAGAISSPHKDPFDPGYLLWSMQPSPPIGSCHTFTLRRRG